MWGRGVLRIFCKRIGRSEIFYFFFLGDSLETRQLGGMEGCDGDI